MEKTTPTSSEDVRVSVASIYADVLEKRKIQRDAKLAEKRERKKQEKKEKEEKELNDDGSKKSKKEKRQQEIEAWRTIIIGLTGDDLEYSSDKKKKKKYRKWIGEEDGSTVLTPKPKKHKKKNYRKEFEPEINMLKSIVAEQNRFTADLQRRFQNAAGPATKDAMPLNKTLVDLAAAINASRSNSLGLLREIGTLKKTVAELYIKQLKENPDSGYNPTDIGLMGSKIGSSMFTDLGNMTGTPVDIGSSTTSSSSTTTSGPIQATAVAYDPNNAEEFDPSTWGGPKLESDAVNFENIPKTIVVEWNKSAGVARFKAIRNDDGSELVGCPVPTVNPGKLTFNVEDHTVKGEFDEMYPLEIIG